MACLEIIAKFIKEVDPNHPTMTVIAGVDPSKAFHIKKYCPNVDILGLNVYGSIENAGKNLRKFNYSLSWVESSELFFIKQTVITKSFICLLTLKGYVGT